MSLAVAILIVVAATGIAVAVMLWVRRKAPDGSYFNDGDRAAGVFGVLATGFAVLLGFVVFWRSRAMTRRERVRSRRRASWPNKSRRPSSSLRRFPGS
jgi:NAD/NADP transhydrogenase alpha subunit